jgi:integrase
VNEISRAEIRECVKEKAKQAPVAGNRLLGVLSRVFNYGLKNDLLIVNPVTGIEAPAREKPKDRVLAESEIAKLWSGLDTVRSCGADVLKLILLTMARSGELCSLEWKDLDIETAVWNLPASKSKNGLPNRIPLTKTVLEILKAQPQKGRYVFPGKQKGNPLDTGSVSRLLNEHKHFGIADHFTPHDARRTSASHAARIGVPRLVVQRLLNHAERGVTARVYELYSYDREKLDALLKLERELLRIIGRAQKADVVEISA